MARLLCRRSHSHVLSVVSAPAGGDLCGGGTCASGGAETSTHSSFGYPSLPPEAKPPFLTLFSYMCSEHQLHLACSLRTGDWRVAAQFGRRLGNTRYQLYDRSNSAPRTDSNSGACPQAHRQRPSRPHLGGLGGGRPHLLSAQELLLSLLCTGLHTCTRAVSARLAIHD